jgi:hypothetical protein
MLSCRRSSLPPHEEEVFLSLVLHHRSPREAPLHKGLHRWASIFFLLLKAEAGLLKWPRSRWTGILQNTVHRQEPLKGVREIGEWLENYVQGELLVPEDE